MMAKSLIWMLFTIGVIGRATACPVNWQEYGGQCYFYNSQKATWDEARSGCEGRGGQLASIHNVDTNNFLHGKMPGGPWIGLSQADSGAPYRWSDGSPLNYENWRSGEANNWGGFEPCVHMHMQDAGGWNDNSCNSRRPSICQLGPACPANWQGYGGECYFFDKQAATWDAAKSGCAGRGGELASIHSEGEYNFLHGKVRGGPWVGLSQADSGAPYQWSDGSPLNYENWRSGEPNNWGGFEPCVHMQDAGGWNDNSCNSQRPSICKLGNACPAKWQGYGGECYFFDTQAATWDAAKSGCAGRGGELASIHDVNEYNFLHGKVPGGPWIGLSQADSAAPYRWTDGSPLNYEYWRSGEPNNWGGFEPCVHMEDARGWNDNSCNSQRPSICKLGNACPANWQEYGGECYFFDTKAATWDAAKSGCAGRGGELASIHDVNEYNFLHGKVPGGPWIGLSQADSGAPYQWTDGSPLNYENWRSGEPNNWGGFEPCVHMEDAGGWNDNSCGSQRPSICKLG